MHKGNFISKIKCLILDKGGEFISKKFEEFCELHGIRRHLLATRTPQHNGVVERKNKIVQEMARTMLNKAKEVYLREQ